jgi:hypothetical protein
VLFFCRVLNHLYVFSFSLFYACSLPSIINPASGQLRALRLAFSHSSHIFLWPVFNVSARLRICASLEGLPLQLTLLHRSAGIKRFSILQR